MLRAQTLRHTKMGGSAHSRVVPLEEPASPVSTLRGAIIRLEVVFWLEHPYALGQGRMFSALTAKEKKGKLKNLFKSPTRQSSYWAGA